MKRLDSSVVECARCCDLFQYGDIDQGLNHLQHDHSKERADPEPNMRQQLSHWLVSTSASEREMRNSRLLKFVETIRRCCGQLLMMASELRNDVADEDNQRSSEYLLPTILVEATMNVFQFVLHTAYSLQLFRKIGEVPSAPVELLELLGRQGDISEAECIARIAYIAMTDSRDELMRMVPPRRSRDSELLHVTPESIVTISLVFLGQRPLLQGLGIIALYEKQFAHLVR